MSDPRLERNIRDLVRWRLIFVLLLLGVPTGLHWLFERQARRLDALGQRAEVTTATVVGVSGDSVSYEYSMGGVRYSWSAAPDDAPQTVGQTFPVMSLADDPELSRPGVDRSRATREAASNRSFSRKLGASCFTFFAVCALACHFNLRRLRARGPAELTDPRAHRTRLAWAAAMLAPFLVLVLGWHAADALRRGESLYPVVLGALLSVSVLGGTAFYVLRQGRGGAAARSKRVLSWAAALASGVFALRLLAWSMGWR